MERVDAQERPIGWWLKHVDGLLEVAFDRSLEREGVGRQHWRMLNAVAGGASTAEEIDQAFTRLGVECVDTTAVLSQLLVRGWLFRRAGRVELTPVGSTARERLMRALRAHRERLIAGIEPESYRVTINTLRQMARNLST
ncbi:MAG TPA: hypothetical protein VGH89_31485 [Pseudonocardia sp.]